MSAILARRWSGVILVVIALDPLTGSELRVKVRFGDLVERDHDENDATPAAREDGTHQALQLLCEMTTLLGPNE